MALVETKDTKDPSGISNIIAEKFSGHQIRVDSKTGYICGSDICKAGGKLWKNYIRNKDSKTFIEYLAGSTGISKTDLMLTHTTGANSTRGTWVHKRIALDLARWISPEVACFIYDIVERFTSGDLSLAKDVLDNYDRINDSNTSFTSRVNPSTGERIAIAETVSNEDLNQNPRHKARAVLKFKRLEHKYTKLQIEHNGVKVLLEEANTGFFEVSNERDSLLIRVNEIAEESRIRAERIAEDTRIRDEETKESYELKLSRIEGFAAYSADKAKKFDKRLDEVLPSKVDIKKIPKSKIPQVWIMRDKDAEENEHNLYVIRAQIRRMKTTVKKLKREYGENIIPSFKITQPNAVAAWETMLQKYSKNIEKDSGSNWFSLKGLTRRQFYEKFKQMDKARTSK